MRAQNPCPICGAYPAKSVEYLPAFPYFTVPVSKPDKKEILRRYHPDQLIAPLDIVACNQCCHCYLNTLPDQAIINFLYANYYHYPSPLRGRFTPERDDRFLEFFQKKVLPLCKKKMLQQVLEVGCFDGYIMHQLMKWDMSVTGCDPSEGALIGQEMGIPIRKNFFKADDFVNEKLSYDIVISRHLIEHLVSPPQWIRELERITNAGGLLILETPNAGFYLKNGLMEIFSLQHLQGFTASSLMHTLQTSGFRVLEMHTTPYDLIAIAYKGTEEEASQPLKDWADTVQSFTRRFEKNKEKIHEMLRPYVHGRKNIGIWGAGGFGLAATHVYDVPLSAIRFFIDTDETKWKMEYLTHSLPIISPQEAKNERPALILIASMYSDSIKKQITDMGFQTGVMTIFPRVTYHA